MSKSKTEQPLTPNDSNNLFETLSPDVAGTIISHSSVSDILNLMSSSITTHNLFKPGLIKLKIMQLAQKARDCVILGDPDGLTLIVKRKAEALFEKGQATDLRSRIYPDISAYQLILFYCDKDMKDKIKQFIPRHLDEQRKAQEKEMGKGGNDLIKLDRDPLLLAEKDFKGITAFETTYTLSNGTQQAVTFPLMENEDGMICYQDTKNVIHFYYANQKTKELKALNESITSEDDKADFDKFKTSFNDMENNSGRRSSHEEHQLIAKILGCTLQRQGIEYEHHGKRHLDSVSPFNLINAYRTCIRLYDEALRNNLRNDLWDKLYASWCTVGKCQGEEMWILQRICEEKPFYPLPTNFNDFKRGVAFYNFLSSKDEFAVADCGKLVSGLGLDFGLYKGEAFRPPGKCGHRFAYACASPGDGVSLGLVAVLRLVKDAKANIIELEQEQSSDLEESSNCWPQ